METYLIWFLVGLFFCASELLLPGIIAIFLGFGAWIIALLCLIGVLPSNSFIFQLILWIVISFTLLLTLRKCVQSWFLGSSNKGSSKVDTRSEFINQEVLVVESIGGQQKLGKIELKGAQWKARSNTSVKKGEIVKIINISGLTVEVESL